MILLHIFSIFNVLENVNYDNIDEFNKKDSKIVTKHYNYTENERIG